MDCLPAATLVLVVEAGGPINVLPVALSLDLVLESDVRAVVAGVPLLEVAVVEFADDGTTFVGDFVGD